MSKHPIYSEAWWADVYADILRRSEVVQPLVVNPVVWDRLIKFFEEERG